MTSHPVCRLADEFVLVHGAIRAIDAIGAGTMSLPRSETRLDSRMSRGSFLKKPPRVAGVCHEVDLCLVDMISS